MVKIDSYVTVVANTPASRKESLLLQYMVGLLLPSWDGDLQTVDAWLLS